jgi:hypothetical protein
MTENKGDLISREALDCNVCPCLAKNSMGDISWYSTRFQKGEIRC